MAEGANVEYLEVSQTLGEGNLMKTLGESF